MLLKYYAIALYSPFISVFSQSFHELYSKGMAYPAYHSNTQVWRKIKCRHLYTDHIFSCSLSKVFECMIYDCIVKFATSSLSSAQFRIRQQLSTLHQLLSFLNGIYTSVNNNFQSDVIYLDFKNPLTVSPITSY